MKRLERELLTTFDTKLQAAGLNVEQRAILKEKTLRIANECDVDALLTEVDNARNQNTSHTQL